MPDSGVPTPKRLALCSSERRRLRTPTGKGQEGRSSAPAWTWGPSQRCEPRPHSGPPCREPEAAGRTRQEGPALPPLPCVNAGWRVWHHAAREWETEPRQLPLRSLKVIKESSQRRDSCHRKNRQTTNHSSGCDTVR